jgi:hypothetical protein
LMHQMFIVILEGERCLHSLFNTASWTRKMSTASQFRKKISSKLVTPIYTGDKSWESQYDSATKYQSMDWWTKSSLRPKKLAKVEDKTMLASGLYKQGVIHQAYVYEGKTVISEFYVQVM